ncbi:MAG: EFR1 family ferrodoxin [Endomicrobiales bacterium]|nr:EFR1 family ferrodoxin [Endomicrobiales bacterium]
MSCAIFYFSSTGNSLSVAKKLASSLGGAELIAIKNAVLNNQINLDGYDKVGIVFPVYAWGPPNIVAKFASKLKNGEGKYIFAVVTYGGMPCATLSIFDKMLKKIGLKLACGFGIAMPGNYIPLYGAISQSKQEKMFAEADKKIEKIATYIKSGKKGFIQKGSALTNWLFSGIIYKGGIKAFAKSDSKFWVDQNCTKCGICAKVCPVKNIILVDGKPTWQGNCQACMACLQWCPTKSIQQGKNTAKRKRYHHPQAKLEDFYV